MTTSAFTSSISIGVDPLSPQGAVLGCSEASPGLVHEGRLLRQAKRVLDLVGAIAGLVLLSPFLLVIALLIKLGSPGPVIFRQRRIGRFGREFSFLKFRTMVVDAEQRLEHLEAYNESAGGVLFKMKNDPRVTRLGRFLRRSSLDEVPQLWNVIRGEMSLVGPRPLQIRDSDRLARLVPGAWARRLSVQPGITGAWQVGGRSETDCFGMLELDLGYVAHWTIGLDLSILCRTFVAVTRGRGAY
jgi:lipopolysaccharide/colanic/teichoic acid biosynthesis glycosyltransferase